MRVAIIGSRNITSIDLSKYVPEGVTEIKPMAFYGCNNLKKLVIPDSVTEIGMRAFAKCHNLSGIDFSDNMTQLEDSILENCSQLKDVT